MCGKEDAALQVINGNLAVSRAQRAEWQEQEALFTSKLKTRKRGETESLVFAR